MTALLRFIRQQLIWWRRVETIADMPYRVPGGRWSYFNNWTPARGGRWDD